MKKNILVAVVVLGVLVAVGLRLAGNAKVAQNKAYLPDVDKAVLVQAKTITKTSFDSEYNYSGTFAPNREILLMPLAQGEVKAVYFAEGKQVAAGQLLLKVDDALLQSQLIAVRAAYENAKTNYERYQKASTSEGITKMQLDGSLLQLKSAESQLKQLEVAISKCTYKAPFAGTITQRSVEIGSVTGGSPIGRLTDMATLKLEVNVPESDITLFKTGLNVQVSTDLYPGEFFKGDIEFVSARGDETHNYMVKIRVPNAGKSKLKAGMYGKVSLQQRLNGSALTIPRTALLGSAKKPQVFAVVDQKAILRNIVTGRNNGSSVEVLDGLKEGDVVVVGGQINLTDSCRVEISK